MPVLEEMIKTMRLGEVARFTAIAPLVANYPFISKAYRKFAQKCEDNDEHNHESNSSGHCCGMTLQQQGLGHKDLDELLKKPVELTFCIELVSFEKPEDYEKEYWQMENEERIDAVPQLKEQGNQLYNAGKVDEAAEKYAKALGILEQLMLKEKPNDDEWNALDRVKVPLLSNYAQCKMLQKDYYAVIEHTNEVLKRDPDNVKALFRRGKAHACVWNVLEARSDFERVRQLDPALDKPALKEMKALDVAQKAKEEEDKAKFKGKIF